MSIALAYNEEAKANLEKAGFVEQTVMVKHVHDKTEGEAEIFRMKGDKPFQFAVVVTDYWGMGPD